MKQHAVSAIVLLILIGLGYWIAQNTYWVEEEVPSQMRGEALRNPFYAVQRFSEALGAKTQWGRSLGELPPPDGVVYLANWHWSLLDERRQRLERWVEAGGRLLVDRSLIDEKDEFERWSGIAREYDYSSENKDPEALERSGSDDCFLFTVQGSRVHGGGREFYRLCGIGLGGVLTSERPIMWALKNKAGMEALRVNKGRGSITVVNAGIFENYNFLQGDHAPLFAASAQLRRGDIIHFISDDESESLLDLMWRLGAPVMVLALAIVALALWRGSARFGPPAATPDLARRSLGEQIIGTGRFTMRFGGGKALHAATVRALTEAASRRIVNFDTLPSGERIAALAQAAKVDAEALAQAMNYSGPHRLSELRNTVALLESARRMIL